MALIRWEPAREMQTIQQEMNRLFNTFYDPSGNPRNGETQRTWIPPMDLVEEQDHFIVRADLPGMSEEEVNIELEDNVLTISGERTRSQEERKEGYYRLERASGRFARSLTLPEAVDPESVSARLENGVLELTIPKPEERKPRRVAINVGQNGAARDGEVIEGSAAGSASQQSQLQDGAGTQAHSQR
jgi:HSP20 family protein